MTAFFIKHNGYYTHFATVEIQEGINGINTIIDMMGAGWIEVTEKEYYSFRSTGKYIN